MRAANRIKARKPDFQCAVHGRFRAYNEYLTRLKNWCMLWVVVAILPLTVLLEQMQVVTTYLDEGMSIQ